MYEFPKRPLRLDWISANLAGLASLLALAFAACAPAMGAPLPATPPSAAASTFVSKVAVFGKDERRVLPPEYRSLKQQIGLLYEPRSHSICTAFCVGRDIIATAAHCLFRTAGEQPLPLASITFRLAGQKAQSEVHLAGAATGGAAQHVTAGSMRPSVRPPIDATHDWALARLARPICTAGGIKLGSYSAEQIARLAAANRVYQVAFHRDFHNWELAYSPCTVQADMNGVDHASIKHDFVEPDKLLLHLCDSGGGSSGSPLLINGSSGPEAVGINVGTYVQSKVMMQNDEVVRRFRPDEIANTGVNTSAVAARLAIFEKAQIIASREQIRQLQAYLVRAGYLRTGTADGLYGAELKAAIEAYEKAHNLPRTGLATETLLKTLAASPGRTPVLPASLGATVK